MSKAEEEQQARLERARAVGLFRYMLMPAGQPGDGTTGVTAAHRCVWT